MPIITRRRRALLLAAVLSLVATACAPGWAHIYSPAEGGDNTVTAVTGTQAVNQTWTVASSHQTRNYTGATWTDTRTGGADGVSRYALRVRGAGLQNGLYGASITYSEPSTLWDDWHYRSGLKIEQAQFVADRILVRNEGDAVKVGVNGTQNGNNFRLSRSWVDGSHDDCFQQEFQCCFHFRFRFRFIPKPIFQAGFFQVSFRTQNSTGLSMAS